MNWLEDWEYPNDHIYAMEKQHDIEVKHGVSWDSKPILLNLRGMVNARGISQLAKDNPIWAFYHLLPFLPGQILGIRDLPSLSKY